MESTYLFGNELAFHRRGLCALGSAHVTNGGSGGMMSTVGLELPYRPSSGTFGGKSNVTFVKR